MAESNSIYALTNACNNCGDPCRATSGGRTVTHCAKDECRKIANRDRYRTLHGISPVAGCAYCSRAFTARNTRRTFFYDIECVRAHRAKAQREGGYSTRSRAKLGRPDSTIAADKRRKATLRGALVADRFKYVDVFIRDNWVCGICLDPVDPETKYPDPMSPSLDHIQAIALGGEHTMENARCSHLVCNVRRQTSEVNDDARATALRHVRSLQASPSS